MTRKNISPDEKLQLLLARFRDVPARDPAAEAAGRRDFLKQAAGWRASASRTAQPSGAGAADRRVSFFQGRGFLLFPAGLAAVALALLMFFGGSAVTVFAAQNSLPGDVLYGIKTFSEDAAFFLPVSPQTKVDLTLRFTDRRIYEITGLQYAGRPIPEFAIERYQDELDLVLALAAGMDDPGMAISLEQASSHADGQLRQIVQLLDTGPDVSVLVLLQNRLREHVQKIELGKTAPQEFRLKIREEQEEKAGIDSNGSENVSQTPDTAPTIGRPSKTPDPGGDDTDADKPTKDRGKAAEFKGTIAAVDAGNLTLTLEDGSNRIFVLTSETKIRIPGFGHDATFADLKVGDGATVRAKKDESGVLVAESIDVEPVQPVLVRYAGTVTDYQAGAGIAIREKNGTLRTFLITSDTKIIFDPKDKSKNLRVGSEVTIAAVRDASGGTPTASEIAVKAPKAGKPATYKGKIAAVDAGSLTLALKDGSSLAFVLTGETKINIAGLGRGATVADLKAGDDATVRATTDESGALVADKIDVKPVQPVLDRYSGTVTDYQAGAGITIREKNGALRTFRITSETKITFAPKDQEQILEVGSEVTITAARDASGGTPIANEIAVKRKKKATPTHPEASLLPDVQICAGPPGWNGREVEKISWSIL
ncbi:MAG: DUF5666 domain-containing protein [Anaerolineales bacterium]